MGAHVQWRANIRARFFVATIAVASLGCGSSSVNANAMSAPSYATVSLSGEPTPSTETAAPNAGSSKTYAIHLHRKRHVGDRTHIVLDLVEDDMINLHASGHKSVQKHLVKHLHLEGDWTTTALDDHQDEAHATIDITKLTEDDLTLLKDKHLDVTKGITKEDAVLKVDGKPVSERIRKDLGSLFSLRIDSAMGDDIVFGSPQPQSVGSHWPIDGDRAREDLLNNTGVSSTAVSGEATFVGVERVGGVDALRIKSELEIDGMIYPSEHPGVTCDPTQGKTVATTLYPIDENYGPIETHTSFAGMARIHVKTPRGTVTGDIDGVARHDAIMTPL